MTTALNRKLALLIVAAFTCYGSTSVAQNGVADALRSAGESSKKSTDDRQINEDSWHEENPYADQREDGGTENSGARSDQKSTEIDGATGGEKEHADGGNGSNEGSSSSGTGRPDEPKVKTKSNPNEPSLDSRIRRLQNNIDRLQRKRDSKQVLNQIDSIDNAQQVAKRYRKLIEREVQRASDQDNAWRKPLVDSLRSRMQTVDELLQEIAAERPQPGSIAERVALNRLNHALLDVYLAALRLRMTELKWMREAEYPAFKIEVKTKALSLNFVSWENNPGMEELVADRVGIVESIKEVRERMSAINTESVSMLATLQLNLKVRLWEFGDRFHEVVVTPANSPIPVIPDAMTKKARLRMEASRVVLDLALLTYPLTVDDMETLREEGKLEIDLSSSQPIQAMQQWVLTDSGNAKIVLIRINSKAPASSTSNADDRLGVDPSDETSGNNGNDELGSEFGENGKANEPDKNDAVDPSKTDTDTDSNESKGSDSSTDPTNDGSEDESERNDDAKGNDQSEDEAETDDGGSTVGFDDDKDQRSPNKDKSTNTPKNDVLSPDLDSKPDRSTPNPDTSNDKNENQNGSAEAAGAGQAVEGNWLSLDGVQRMPTQRVHGFWENTQSDVVEWFEVIEDRLVVRPTDNFRSMGIDVYRRKNSNRYFGRAYTVPRNGNCTHVGFWQPAALRVSQGKTRGNWNGKKVEEDTCKLGELPDGGDLNFDRVLVTSFQPLSNGKLLHVTASPSVGNQRSQLKATAKISVRLSDVPGSIAKVYLDQQLLQRSASDDAFDFLTTRSGRHELRVDILTSGGKLLHQEDVRIDVPGVPGIGN